MDELLARASDENASGEDLIKIWRKSRSEKVRAAIIHNCNTPLSFLLDPKVFFTRVGIREITKNPVLSLVVYTSADLSKSLFKKENNIDLQYTEALTIGMLLTLHSISLPLNTFNEKRVPCLQHCLEMPWEISEATITELLRQILTNCQWSEEARVQLLLHLVNGIRTGLRNENSEQTWVFLSRIPEAFVVLKNSENLLRSFIKFQQLPKGSDIASEMVSLTKEQIDRLNKRDIEITKNVIGTLLLHEIKKKTRKKNKR